MLHPLLDAGLGRPVVVQILSSAYLHLRAALPRDLHHLVLAVATKQALRGLATLEGWLRHEG